MADLHDLLASYVAQGSLPGAVALLGFGGSVDIAAIDPWNVPGRYGWVGGTGTAAHVNPSAGTVAILLTQVAADSPVAPGWMRDFWRYTAGAC